MRNSSWKFANQNHLRLSLYLQVLSSEMDQAEIRLIR
jgi:hypothetical protein